jgi:DNA polymerase-3 subunit gamma/tau
LKEIVEAEGIRVEEPALFGVARAADGSMRDAQSILDQLVSFSEGEITVSDTHAMLGTVGPEVYRRIAAAISGGDSSLILETLDELIERGKDLAQFLKELTLYFRNLLVTRMEGGRELIDLPEEDLSALKEVGAGFTQAGLIKIVQGLSELESRFRQLPSPRVAVEMHLMKLSETGADVSIDSILSKLTAMERRLKSSGTGPPPAVSVGRQMTLDKGGSEIAELPSERYIPVPEDTAEEISEQPESPAPPAEEGGDPQLTLWRQFLGKVREQSMSIYSFLEKGRFCGVQSGQMIICFDDGNSYNKTHLERREIRMLLEETLKSIAGDPLRIKLIIERGDTGTPSHPGEPEPEQVKATRREEARKQSVEKALENPIVKKTAELFRGKIVYVSG